MLPPVIEIENRTIGRGYPPFIIAEVAQAHDGSLGAAHAYIDIAADAGVDAIKFQTHIADAESTQEEQFRLKFSMQDRNRFFYWRRMEFSEDQWRGLAEHARSRQLIFLSSAFSLEAVDLLSRIGMPAWKIGSGEIRSMDLISAMLKTRVPLLLSTGMGSWAEIEQVVRVVKEYGGALGIFQCSSLYPTPIAKVGLNIIDELYTRFGCPVGLSDHSGKLWPSVAALARGAELIEVHICLHRSAFGPDTSSSLTPDELRMLVEAGKTFWELQMHPIDKDSQAEAMGETKKLFGKSIALCRSLSKGDAITKEVITFKKPGTGIPAEDLCKVLGKRIRKDVSTSRLLTYDDIEES